jgi:hypothetical protein
LARELWEAARDLASAELPGTAKVAARRLAAAVAAKLALTAGVEATAAWGADEGGGRPVPGIH